MGDTGDPNANDHPDPSHRRWSLVAAHEDEMKVRIIHTNERGAPEYAVVRLTTRPTGCWRDPATLMRCAPASITT